MNFTAAVFPVPGGPDTNSDAEFFPNIAAVKCAFNNATSFSRPGSASKKNVFLTKMSTALMNDAHYTKNY